ncbi:MAG: hypothetical protein ABI557_18490 [Aureliella sp.]
MGGRTMSDNPNPYQPPDRQPPTNANSASDFGEVIRRGFAAAHARPAGGIWMFILLAPIQIQNTIMASIVFNSGLLEQLQRGNIDTSNGPPPALLMLMGVGCFSCIWLLALLGAIPWIWGGSAGQLRAQLIGANVGRFGDYGRQNYGGMLAFLLMFVVVAVVLSIPNAIVNQVVSAGAVRPGQPWDAETARSLARHPANIVSSVGTVLLFAGAGTLLNVLISVSVAVGRGFRAGLGAGFAFCSDNLKSIFKLYLMYVLLMLPVVILAWIPQLVTPSIWIGIVFGVLSAAYLGYLSLANLGLANALVVAKPE